MSNKELAQMIVDILHKKANKGCKQKCWKDFENGDGEPVGIEIDNLIKIAKKILKNEQ